MVFPDGRVDQPQPIAAPEELTVDAAELVGPERLRVRIQELFAFWRREREVVMTPAAVRQITEEVGRSLTMRSSLGPDIAEADRRIIELSEQQVALLDLMREGRRVQVLGCAGSGKTLLAAHKARLLAAQGYDVLLTCYNEPLATYLRRNLTGVEGLEVRSYHQLCSRWADLAGVPLHWPERRTAAFFERVLPEALEKAVERTGPSFDAVVVDEAQDFARMWWTPLLRLLRDGDDSILYVFADDNQRLYRRPPGMPEGLFPFTLNQNWRNTRRINAKVAEFYSGHPIVCMGPQGLPVEIREAATTEDVRRAVLDAVRRLVREDEVPVGDIVVLTPGAVQSSGLLGPLGDGLQLAEEPHGPDAIRLESVFRFKGMEATVVVLAGVPRTDQARPEVMYVGCSRARSHLVLVEMP